LNTNNKNESDKSYSKTTKNNKHKTIDMNNPVIYDTEITINNEQ